MTVKVTDTARQGSSVGLVQPGTVEELRAAHDVAAAEYDRAAVVEKVLREVCQAYERASDAAYQRYRQAYEAWRQATQPR